MFLCESLVVMCMWAGMGLLSCVLGVGCVLLILWGIHKEKSVAWNVA